MQITATELKANISYYLSLVDKEDVIITRNGKKIARIIHEEEDLIEIAKSLFGILPSDSSIDELKNERMRRYEDSAGY